MNLGDATDFSVDGRAFEEGLRVEAYVVGRLSLEIKWFHQSKAIPDYFIWILKCLLVICVANVFVLDI